MQRQPSLIVAPLFRTFFLSGQGRARRAVRTRNKLAKAILRSSLALRATSAHPRCLFVVNLSYRVPPSKRMLGDRLCGCRSNSCGTRRAGTPRFAPPGMLSHKGKQNAWWSVDESGGRSKCTKSRWFSFP